jgi:hypothetical protein
MLDGFIHRIGGLLRLGPDTQLDGFLILRHAYRVVRTSEYRSSPGFSLIPTTKALRRDWIGTYVWVEARYVPRPYPGNVVYLWARAEPNSRRVAWSKLVTAEVEEHRFIPGTHTTCRTDQLHGLAHQLRMCLSAAQPAITMKGTV